MEVVDAIAMRRDVGAARQAQGVDSTDDVGGGVLDIVGVEQRGHGERNTARPNDRFLIRPAEGRCRDAPGVGGVGEARGHGDQRTHRHQRTGASATSERKRHHLMSPSDVFGSEDVGRARAMLNERRLVPFADASAPSLTIMVRYRRREKRRWIRRTPTNAPSTTCFVPTRGHRPRQPPRHRASRVPDGQRLDGLPLPHGDRRARARGGARRSRDDARDVDGRSPQGPCRGDRILAGRRLARCRGDSRRPVVLLADRCAGPAGRTSTRLLPGRRSQPSRSSGPGPRLVRLR